MPFPWLAAGALALPWLAKGIGYLTRPKLPEPGPVFGGLGTQAKELYGTPFWETEAGKNLISMFGESLTARTAEARETGYENIEEVMHRRGILGSSTETGAYGELEKGLARTEAEQTRQLWMGMYQQDIQRQTALANTLMQLGMSEAEAKIALQGMQAQMWGQLWGSGAGEMGQTASVLPYLTGGQPPQMATMGGG